MKYIKLFDTVSAYTETRNNDYFEPWLSYTEENDEVNYNKGEDEKLPEMPLTFEITSGGNITWSYYERGEGDYYDATKTIYYSKNGGEWTEMPRTLSVAAGDEVQFRSGSGYDEGEISCNTFAEGTTAAFNVKGNIMSLISSSDFATLQVLSSEYAFYRIFGNCTGLTDASKLVLPATELTMYCYAGMFQGCTSLTTAPSILPATTLAEGCCVSMFRNCTSLTTAPAILTATALEDSCYNGMFQGCTSLTTAPELPATTLASGCYDSMFEGCTSLTTAPVLPATALEDYCYGSMFRNCTSLATAPVLPATALEDYCYQSMFYGCTSLNYIKAMFTTTPSKDYTEDWVEGVSSTGTFVKNASATWTTTGVYGIPDGWTVETASE